MFIDYLIIIYSKHAIWKHNHLDDSPNFVSNSNQTLLIICNVFLSSTSQNTSVSTHTSLPFSTITFRSQFVHPIILPLSFHSFFIFPLFPIFRWSSTTTALLYHSKTMEDSELQLINEKQQQAEQNQASIMKYQKFLYDSFVELRVKFQKLMLPLNRMPQVCRYRPWPILFIHPLFFLPSLPYFLISRVKHTTLSANQMETSRRALKRSFDVFSAVLSRSLN